MPWINLFQKAIKLEREYRIRNFLPDIYSMTKELYTTKLDKSIFDNKVYDIIFNNYTGYTSGATTIINNKLDIPLFLDYTGNTNTIIEILLIIGFF